MNFTKLLALLVPWMSTWRRFKCSDVKISVDIISHSAGGTTGIWRTEKRLITEGNFTATGFVRLVNINDQSQSASVFRFQNSQTEDTDILILDMDWKLLQTVTSRYSIVGRTLLMYKGMMTDITMKYFPSQTGRCPNSSMVCSPHFVQNRSLFNDFLVLKDDYTAVMSTVLKSLAWDKAVLVSDGSTAFHVNSVMSVLLEANLKINHVEIRAHMSDHHIFNLLFSAYNSGVTAATKFILFCEVTCINRIVSAAQAFDVYMDGETALSHMSFWIVVTACNNIQLIEQSLSTLNNIAVITPAHVSDELNTQDLSQVLRYVAVKEESFGNVSEDSMGEAKTRIIDSMVHTLTKHGCRDRTFCPLFEIQTALWKPDGRRFNLVGQWSRDQGLKKEDIGVFPNEKFGFNNQTLHIATNTWPVFMEMDTKTGDYGGVCFEILLALSVALNFSYVLYIPADGEWGVLRNGRWTGLVRELELRRANMTVAPLAVTAEREDAVDFAQPFYFDYSGVLIKKKDEASTKWKSLSEIFTYPVYLLIVVSLPVMTFFVYFSAKINSVQINDRKRSMTEGFYKFGEILFHLYGYLLTQGSIRLPGTMSGFTLLSFWLIYAVVLVASYKGNLIAYLTVSKASLPFNTLKEMGEQDEYKYGTLPGTFLELLFQQSNVSEYKRIWAGIQLFEADYNSLHPDHNEHIDMVRSGSYAYIAEKSGAEKIVRTECDMTFIGEEFFPVRYAIGLPHNSPYKDMISEQMLKMSQGGLIKKWTQKWQPRNNCTVSILALSRIIQLIDVQSAFYILLPGMALGAMALSAEIVRSKCQG